MKINIRSSAALPTMHRSPATKWLPLRRMRPTGQRLRVQRRTLVVVEDKETGTK